MEITDKFSDKKGGDTDIYLSARLKSWLLSLTGKIAFSDLLTSMPFGNDIVALTVKGTTLKEAFENSAFAKSDEEKSGRFLQHAGKYELGVIN